MLYIRQYPTHYDNYRGLDTYLPAQAGSQTFACKDWYVTLCPCGTMVLNTWGEESMEEITMKYICELYMEEILLGGETG